MRSRDVLAFLNGKRHYGRALQKAGLASIGCSANVDRSKGYPCTRLRVNFGSKSHRTGNVKEGAGTAEAAQRPMSEKNDDADYLCDDGCWVDLSGYFWDFTSRADCAVAGRRH
jgi:hypothetical protein